VIEELGSPRLPRAGRGLAARRQILDAHIEQNRVAFTIADQLEE
jgi:hypothetical protein